MFGVHCNQSFVFSLINEKDLLQSVIVMMKLDYPCHKWKLHGASNKTDKIFITYGSNEEKLTT